MLSEPGRFTIAELVGLIFIIAGAILFWLKVDDRGLVLNSGFVLFGTMALAEAVRRKQYFPVTADFFLFLIPVIIIILGLRNCFDRANYSDIAALCALYSFFKSRKELKRKNL